MKRGKMHGEVKQMKTGKNNVGRKVREDRGISPPSLPEHQHALPQASFFPHCTREGGVLRVWEGEDTDGPYTRAHQEGRNYSVLTTKASLHITWNKNEEEFSSIH